MNPTGQWLKKERELRQISLEEIAKKTHIRLTHLRAMEADHWSDLPGQTFALGYVRAYAGYVGLAPDEALLHYQAYLKKIQSPSVKRAGTLPRWPYGLAVVALAAALGLALWYWL